MNQIQADIDALQSGGELKLPPGEFRLTEPLRDNGQDNVTITGSGWSTKIIAETPDQSAFCIGPRRGWVIRDLSIYGTGFDGDLTMPLPEGCGVAIDGAEHCRVTGVLVENFRKGVYLRRSCRHCRVDRCDFIDLNNAVNEDAYLAEPGVYPVGNQAHNNTSIRCRAHYILDNRNPNGLVGGVGMLISGNVLIGHNAAASVEFYGIRLYDAIGAVVTSNILQGLEGGIELMRDTRDCRVADNAVSAFVSGVYSGHGVWLHKEPLDAVSVPSGNSIAGNVVVGAWGHGIFAEAGRDNDVNGNSLSNCGRNGIRVSSPYVGVRSNRIKYVGEHGIYVTGAPSGSTQIVGNFLKGNQAHAGELQQWDAVHVDAAAGGPVVVVANELRNDQVGAGWRYGIHHSSGGMLVEHAHNKSFRLAGTVNPANLPALP